MSKEALVELRSRIEDSRQLQKAVRTAAGGGKSWDLAALVALGEREGLSFTAEEARTFLTELDQSELSDFELELVAGGLQAEAKKTDSGSKFGANMFGAAAARGAAAAALGHAAE
jgi:hypothetical protein